MIIENIRSFFLEKGEVAGLAEETFGNFDDKGVLINEKVLTVTTDYCEIGSYKDVVYFTFIIYSSSFNEKLLTFLKDFDNYKIYGFSNFSEDLYPKKDFDLDSFIKEISKEKYFQINFDFPINGKLEDFYKYYTEIRNKLLESGVKIVNQLDVNLIKNMNTEKKITACRAYEIKDSRNKPTIEVEMASGDVVVKASVPSGASTGSREALEKRDADGKGVQEAIRGVNEIIAPAIIGQEVNPLEIDKIILKLDGTENKSNLGANALLGVSLVVTRLGAKLEEKPLWKYINEISGVVEKPALPRLYMNVMNGGAHADFKLPFQEYIIVPNEKTVSESYEKARKILDKLGEILKAKYGEVTMGDEGGYSPKIDNLNEPFEILSDLIDEKTMLALDVAGSEFYKNEKYNILGTEYSSEQFIKLYEELVGQFPIGSIEDPFAENDWDAFAKLVKDSRDWDLKAKDENRVEDLIVVGDDLTTTNVKTILEMSRNKRANAVIIKPNQIGTLSEVYGAVKIAQGAGWKIICSHRSGETMDDFISDLAVGLGAFGIKAGSPYQDVRRVKYERLLEIEKEIIK